MHGLRAMTRCGAIVCLVAVAMTTGAQQAPKAWLERIADSDANVRRAAWEEAGKHGPEAIIPLGRLMAKEDPGVARAARLALEAIVSASAAPDAGDKRLVASQALCTLVNSDFPATVRALQVCQLSLVGGDEAVPVLKGLLGDAQLNDDARQALSRIPGPVASAALLEGLDRAGLDGKLGFINALADRTAVEATFRLIELAADPMPELRIAALNALGRLGVARGIPPAMGALASDDPAERKAAADALVRLAEVQRHAGARDSARRMYERVLRSEASTGQRVAALTGLKAIGDPTALDSILRSLGDPDPVFHELAMSLIDEFAAQDVVRVMTQAAGSASPAARAGLMLGLASRNDGTVAPTLRAGLSDESDEVKAAAATGLGIISEASAAPELLRLAELGRDPAKSAALSSYLKLLAAQLATGKTLELLNAFNHALEIATGDAERNLALSSVAAFGDPSSLALVEPLTTEEGTREAALRAYVAIGKTLLATDAERAKTIFRNTIARGAPRDLAGEAAAQLRALGVDIDLARESGFITTWWLVGAFPNKDQRGFDEAYPPETEANPERPVAFQGKDLAWKQSHTDDVQGIVSLEPLFDPRTDVVVYAYAVVTVPAEQAVTLRIGSDDAVKVWVNGEQVHANNAYRPLTVDEDRAEARLKAGENRLLVKIVQGGGQWSFCLRITSADGRPVRFEQ